MGDDFIASMGFDSSDFDRSFDKAVRNAEAGAKKLGGSLVGAKKAFFDLAGDRRVESQMGSLSKELANAGSAADVAGIALNRLENVFQSSLGVGVAVAAVTTIISKVSEATKRWDEFRESGVRAGQDVLRALSEDKIPEAVDKIGKRLAEINKERGARNTFFGSLTSGISDALSGTNSGAKNVEMAREEVRLKKNRDDAIIAGSAKARDNIRDADWKLIEDRVEREDKAAEEIAANRKKWQEDFANFAIQNAAKEGMAYWKTITDIATKRRAEIEANAKQHEEIMAENALNIAKQKFQALADVADAARQLEDAKENQAVQNRGEAFDKAMQTPEQRGLERAQERAENRADESAAKRIAQAHQDAQNGMFGGKRVTDAERDQIAKDLLEKRKMDKRPEADKAVDRAQDKANQANAQAKDFKAINLIVDVMRNAL